MYFVYQIENTTNGRRYTGNTNNAKLRAGQHSKMLRGCYHYNRDLQIDFIRGHKFTFTVLYEFEERWDAELMEPRQIELRDYNIWRNYRERTDRRSELKELLKGVSRKKLYLTNPYVQVTLQAGTGKQQLKEKLTQYANQL